MVRFVLVKALGLGVLVVACGAYVGVMSGMSKRLRGQFQRGYLSGRFALKELANARTESFSFPALISAPNVLRRRYGYGSWLVSAGNEAPP